MVEADLFELLVRAVHLVVIQPESHKERVHTQDRTQRCHHRDRPAAAHQHRRLAILIRQGRQGGAHMRTVDIDLDARGRA